MKHMVIMVAALMVVGDSALADDKGDFSPGPAIDFIKRSCYDHERWSDIRHLPEQNVLIDERSGSVTITRETSGEVWYKNEWRFNLKNVKINKRYSGSGVEVVCQTSKCIHFSRLRWDTRSGYDDEKDLGEVKFSCSRDNTARALSDLANFYGGGAKTPYD